jgi:RNA polymerase sigma-70 factor (ECF subfamily)
VTTDDQEPRARFERIFDHYGRLVAYAQRRGAPDAEAVASEALETAWRRLECVPAEDPLPWLYRTAGWVMANQRRAAARSGVPHATPPEPGDEMGDPLDRQLRRTLDPELERALLELPRRTASCSCSSHGRT